MKKIWNAIGRNAKNWNYQRGAIKEVEKIEAGKIKRSAPKHQTEQKYFEEAQKNEEARKDLETKDDSLIANMNKLSIKSTDPVERWTPTKEGPTRETEWLHRNDPTWEFGFYEPPEEKIPKGKLMFREALEVMRARLELEGNVGPAREQIPEAEKLLSEHPAIRRVPKEALDTMWAYFRPFERRDTQEVVKLVELERLQDYLQGNVEEIDVVETFREQLKQLASRGNATAERALEHLDEEHAKEFVKAVQERREAERERLSQRLLQIEAIEAQPSGAEGSNKAESDSGRQSSENKSEESRKS